MQEQVIKNSKKNAELYIIMKNFSVHYLSKPTFGIGTSQPLQSKT